LFNDKVTLDLRVLNLANNRKLIPQGQADHDLNHPAPRYIELRAGYKF